MRFECVGYGLAGPAGYVAVLNIAARNAVSLPIVPRNIFEPQAVFRNKGPISIGGSRLDLHRQEAFRGVNSSTFICYPSEVVGIVSDQRRIIL